MTSPDAHPSANPIEDTPEPTQHQRLSVMGREWTFRKFDERTALAISQAHGLPAAVAEAITARGIGIDEVVSFIDPTLKDLLPDPSRFRDMDKAANRIADAVLSGEKIALFADYDVDGATSSSVMARFLRACGNDPIVYIPDRISEGYGPSEPALQKLAAQGAKLIITLDCGTTAFDALGAGRDLNVDIIVIDHHEAEPRLPDVHAVVNPTRMDDDRVYGHLCTAGLAFIMAVAINRTLRSRDFWTLERPAPVLTRLLDLVALGTVCDVVNLTGLNRALVVQGLKVLAKRANTGLRALADVAGLNETPGSYHLGFVLGPRINAGGRIGDSGIGATLLRSDDDAESAALATKLNILNAERKQIEADVFSDALEHAYRLDENNVVTVVAGDGWHPGVVGIVASRLVERFGKPACVIAMGDKLGTGSGRSIPGIDLGAAIIAARQSGHLIKGGGHAMAAGFSVSRDGLSEFNAFLQERIKSQTGEGPMGLPTRLDGRLSIRGATFDLAQSLELMAPFGPGNPEPRFLLEGVRISYSDIVGADHLRMTISGAAGAGSVDGIAFRCVGTPLGELLSSARDTPIDLVGRLKTDTWGGRTRAKFHVEDAARI